MVTALYQSAVSVSLEGAEVAWIPFTALVIFGLIVILPLALFRRWYFYRRRLKKNVITAEYEPPLGFNPAEIGYLFDGKLREHEIGATIIHLVQAGFLHVKKIEGHKKIFAGPRVGLNLKPYEAKLIEVADTPDGATLNQMLHRFFNFKPDNNEINLTTMKQAFSIQVHNNLQLRGYVSKFSIRKFFMGVFKITLLLQILIFYGPFVFLGLLGTFQNGTVDFESLRLMVMIPFFLSCLFFLPFALVALVLYYIRGRIVGREWIITPQLEKLWPQIIGYRQYVKMVENERLEFHSKGLAKISKNDSLPYAVALGFVKNWRDILS